MHIDTDWMRNGVAGAVWVRIKNHIPASDPGAIASAPDGAVAVAFPELEASCASDSDRRVVRHWFHRHSMHFAAILVDSAG